MRAFHLNDIKLLGSCIVSLRAIRNHEVLQVSLCKKYNFEAKMTSSILRPFYCQAASNFISINAVFNMQVDSRCNSDKLRKQFRDSQRVPFMLDKTRKPLFAQLGTKTHSFLKNWVFFRKMSHAAEECKRGDPLGFINIHSVANYQKTRRGDPFQTKNFGKKVAQC